MLEEALPAISVQHRGDAAGPHEAPVFAQRTRRGLAAAALGIALCGSVAVAVATRLPKSWHVVPDWIAVPVQLLAVGGCATLCLPRRRTRQPDRLVWQLVLAFCVMSLAANVVWNIWRPLGKVPALSFADACYFADYALLTAAYAVAFVRLGGSFRDPDTWLDAVTMMVALLAAFWGTLLGTFLPAGHGQRIGLTYAMAYAVSLSAWMAMGALLLQRLPARRPIALLLLGAGLIDAVWELGWLATWLTGRNYVGLYYNIGDVLCFTLITCAAALAKPGSDLDDDARGVERSVYAFIPTLTALFAIGLVGASLTSTRTPDAWFLIGLVILIALLLFTRREAARRRMAELNRALAFRVADARLTELVRESAEALWVIDLHGRVAFASAATSNIIGIESAKTIGAPAAALFGAGHRAAITEFLARLAQDTATPGPLELVIEHSGNLPRTLKLHGANRLRNTHIDGLTLMISDISEQRALERDVLTAANHERLRLAGDIHDGLGQELSGIAFMLQGLSKTPGLVGTPQHDELQDIIGHVVQTIRGARDLARGLSPIYVVRGSLCEALRRLARAEDPRPYVLVDIDASCERLVFNELPADHLYRIAREALQNSIRHGACSQIAVSMRAHEESLRLTIVDDGVGYHGREVTDSGFGLRLMAYRARVIGANFDIARAAAGGTIVTVSVRVRDVARSGSPS